MTYRECMHACVLRRLCVFNLHYQPPRPANLWSWSIFVEWRRSSSRYLSVTEGGLAHVTTLSHACALYASTPRLMATIGLRVRQEEVL